MKQLLKPYSLMLLLPQVALAAPAAQGDSPASMLPMLGIFALVFYFVLIRPQTQQAKKHKSLIDGLKKNDEIVTEGGLLGKVVDLGPTFATLMLAKDVHIQVKKTSISAVMPQGTFKN